MLPSKHNLIEIKQFWLSCFNRNGDGIPSSVRSQHKPIIKQIVSHQATVEQAVSPIKC